MKIAIILAILSVVAVGQTAVVPNRTSRLNLQVGYAYPGDRLLYRTYLYKPALYNAVQYQDFTWRGNVTNRISMVTVTEVGAPQDPMAWVTYGGVGWNTVSLRVQSARGRGYYYMIDIWGV